VEKGYFGDYGNLALTVDISASSLGNTFGGGGGLPVPVPTPGAPTPGTRTPTPTSSLVPTVPSLPAVPPLSSRWLRGSTIDALLLGVLR
jgi:hypothetical protein